MIFGAMFLLTAAGITLIIKGLTNTVWTLPSGDPIAPRWMYVLGGLVLLVFPVIWFLVTSDIGRKWLFR